ncbi:hypothetical protein ABFS83_08G202500 [Erythranthe nasuta]
MFFGGPIFLAIANHPFTFRLPFLPLVLHVATSSAIFMFVLLAITSIRAVALPATVVFPPKFVMDEISAVLDTCSLLLVIFTPMLAILLQIEIFNFQIRY